MRERLSERDDRIDAPSCRVDQIEDGGRLGRVAHNHIENSCRRLVARRIDDDELKSIGTEGQRISSRRIDRDCWVGLADRLVGLKLGHYDSHAAENEGANNAKGDVP